MHGGSRDSHDLTGKVMLSIMASKYRQNVTYVVNLVVNKMYRERVEEAFTQNYGVLKASELRELKVDSRAIRRLIEGGVMERIKTGYYRSLTIDPGEAATVVRLYPEGVLWLHTALFYYNYSDRTPLEWELLVSKNISRSRFELDYPVVKPFFVRPEELSFGITTMKIDGVTMNILDRDRLICECLRYERDLDSETFNKAIQGYLGDQEKNIRNLMSYAKRRRVSKRVHDILGVWL